MIIAVKTEFFGLDSNGNRVTIAHFVGDSSADLPSLSAYTSGGVQITVGSTFHSVTDGADYEMTSAGVWVLSQPGQAAYTKAEVDALLTDKADVVDVYTKVQVDAIAAAVDFCSVGTTIPANSDLNSYTTKGIYNCGATNAATLLNCPVTAGFRLEVVEIAFSTRHQQRLYTQQVAGDSIYIRTEGGSGYGSWYKFTGTAV